MTEELLKRIVVDPKVLAGKPIVRGTRISVAQVLGHMAGGWAKVEILENYPTLKDEDINACLAYAHDVISGEEVMPSAA